jgi:hypothetical protein
MPQQDSSDEMVKRSFYVPQGSLDKAQWLADRHLESGKASVVMRRAIDIGLKALKKEPALLLKSHR